MTNFKRALTLSSTSIFDCQYLQSHGNLKIPSSQLAPVSPSPLVIDPVGCPHQTSPFLHHSAYLHLLTSVQEHHNYLFANTQDLTPCHFMALLNSLVQKNTKMCKSGFALHSHACCRVTQDSIQLM